jgi:hypothetical protein
MSDFLPFMLHEPPEMFGENRIFASSGSAGSACFPKTRYRLNCVAKAARNPLL